MTTWMVIERFKDADAVYRRFAERGRLAPDGLRHVASWVDEKIERCFQVMQAEDRALLDEWIGRWRDVVDFEVHVVIGSDAAAEAMAARR